MTAPTVLNRPTYAQLLARRRADYQSHFPNGDAMRTQGVLPAFAQLDAMQQTELHGHLDAVAAAQHPMFAVGPWLDAWAVPFRTPRKAATRAGGTVAFTGSAGATVAAGAILRRADGVEYQVTEAVTASGGQAVATVEALDAGASGNALAGLTLQLVSPVAGLDPAGLVQAPGLTGGTDTEGDEPLRARVLRALREPAQGGSNADWLRWALEVPGVTRAWVTENAMGLGTMTVRFVMDEVHADRDGIPVGDGAPNPYTGDLLTVWEHIEAKRPAGMKNWFVVAPVARGLDVEVSGLAPDTADTRAAVDLELRDLLLRVSAPGATIRRSWVREAISAATGESYHGAVRMAAAGNPLADAESVTYGVNELPVLGSVTYV